MFNKHTTDKNSVVALVLCCKTEWSKITSIVGHAHGLVTIVAWDLNMLVLDYVLLDYGGSCLLGL